MLRYESRQRADFLATSKKNKKISRQCFWCFFLVLFSLCILHTNNASAEIIRKNSALNVDCNMVCSAYDAGCVGITNSDSGFNSAYCSVGDTPDTCQNNIGGCSTIIWDEGFEGCNNASSTPECFAYPLRQSSWTYCLCDIEATTTPPVIITGTHDFTEDIPINNTINLITGIVQTYDQSSTSTPVSTSIYAFNVPFILIIFVFILFIIIFVLIKFYLDYRKL
jgi:hypothetical protein